MIAAFLIPGLVLRDTGVLTISRQELRESTLTAQHELERRQTIARDAGHVAPYLGLACLICGVALVTFGLPRLKRQEKTADEHAQAEVDKLHAELIPQTKVERQERAEAEVKEEQTSEPRPIERPAAGDASLAWSHRADIEAWIRAESEVITRLAAISPPIYELQSQVKLEGGDTGTDLRLDALLIGHAAEHPDIIVEIKAGGRGVLKNLRNRLAQAESQLLRYRSRYRRDSIGWLILYTNEDLTISEREKIIQRAKQFADLVKVSIVTPDDLASLTLPVKT